MTILNLSPERLSIAYELLRGTKPFYRWGLPEAEGLCFRVYRSKTERGEIEREGDRITIGISEQSNGHLYSVFETLAHEMVHLRLMVLGIKSWDCHGGHFERLAQQVCAVHGFDPKSF
jgi:hypothetical protein